MPSPITVTGVLQDISAAANGGKVTFTLVGYGNNPPMVSGSALLADIAQSVQAAGADGTFSISLWGNDQITPAGSYYQVDIVGADGSRVSTAAYQFTGSGPYNLSSLTPLVTFPVAPRLSPLLANIGGTQLISGGLSLTGSLTTSDLITKGPWLDVRAFGAKGDGVADDTAAVQAAINAASAFSRTLRLPSGRYKISSTLQILTPGLRLLGSGMGRPESSGGTSLDYYGTGACIQLGLNKLANLTSIVRSGNVVTATFPALPTGAGVFRVGNTVTIAGVLDSSFNGTFTVTALTATTVTYSQTAANASSSGGTITEPYDQNAYDGIQSLTVMDMDIRYQGSATTPLLNGQNTYGTGTYGILDWRGGDINLRNVGFERFQYGFYGIQSDINKFERLQPLYCSVGMYIGPRSDQFTCTETYAFFNDTVVWLDHALHSRFKHAQFVGNGSATTPPFRITNSNWTTGGDSAAKMASVIEDCWFEHLQSGVSNIGSFIEIGVNGGVIDPTACAEISIIRPFIANNPQANTPHAQWLVTVGNATAIRVVDPKNNVNNLAALFNFVGSTSPNVEYDRMTAAGVAVYVNNGTGSPRILMLDNNNPSTPIITSATDVGGNLCLNSGVSTSSTISGFSLSFQDRGTTKWYLQKDGSNVFRVFDAANNLQRMSLSANGGTTLSAGTGANDVQINVTPNSGTSGFSVWSGGATPTKVITLGGNGVITQIGTSFTQNSGDAGLAFVLNGGATTAQTATFSLQDQGITKWQLQKDSGNVLRLFDVADSSKNRLVLQTAAGTTINAGGTAAVTINGSTNAGTGGLVVQSGGATPTSVLTVSGSGTITHVGQTFTQSSGDVGLTHALNGGTSAVQTVSLSLQDQGTTKWQLQKDASNVLRLFDSADSSKSRLIFQTASSTIINSGGTSAVLINNANNAGTGGLQVWSGGVTSTQVASVDATGKGTFNGGVVSSKTVVESKQSPAITTNTLTIDASTGGIFRINLNANVTTMSLTNPADGQVINIVWVQDATGSRTVAFPANVKGATAPSATANSRSAQSFTYDSTTTNWYALGAGSTGM